MSGKRLLLAAALAILMASAGCTRYWCEHRGYYPAAPACQPCCVPCCPCGPATTGYAAPAWNAPAAVAAPAAGCCCPPPGH